MSIERMIDADLVPRIGDGQVRRDGRTGCRTRVQRQAYGWKSAIVLPSGSLNHADLPTGVVAMWLTVLNVSVS